MPASNYDAFSFAHADFTGVSAVFIPRHQAVLVRTGGVQ
jgi:hypothetical protein